MKAALRQKEERLKQLQDMREKVVQKVEANKRSLDQEWRQSQKKLSMEVFKDNPLLEERKKEV